MSVMTVQIDLNTKAGKALKELIDILPEKKGIRILESDTKSPYSAKFVKKIKTAEKRAEYKEVNPENVWESIKSK